MGEVEYKKCTCGFKRIAQYNKQTEEGTEFCDVCGTYIVVQIINKPKYNVITDKWIPEYKKTEISTGFVLKIWQKEKEGVMVSCVEKKMIKAIRNDLDKDERVIKYAITFKDTNGNYQTQIFKK